MYLTRNQAMSYGIRGFESLPLRQITNKALRGLCVFKASFFFKRFLEVIQRATLRTLQLSYRDVQGNGMPIQGGHGSEWRITVHHSTRRKIKRILR